MKKGITIEEVLALKEPAEDYYCQREDNIYGIEFTYFRMRNPQTNQVLFQFRKPESEINNKAVRSSRFIKYHFSPDFFKFKNVSTTVEFQVGAKPVKDLLMIEKHFFQKKLIKEYEFQIPFCIPNCRANLESIYELPNLGPQLIKDMINNPFKTVSDSYYFVQGKLIMHNKAAYSYAPFK